MQEKVSQKRGFRNVLNFLYMKPKLHGARENWNEERNMKHGCLNIWTE